MSMLTSESLNPNLVQDDPYSLSLISTNVRKTEEIIFLTLKQNSQNNEAMYNIMVQTESEANFSFKGITSKVNSKTTQMTRGEYVIDQI